MGGEDRKALTALPPAIYTYLLIKIPQVLHVSKHAVSKQVDELTGSMSNNLLTTQNPLTCRFVNYSQVD